jgi:hypothetical protein
MMFRNQAAAVGPHRHIFGVRRLFMTSCPSENLFGFDSVSAEPPRFDPAPAAIAFLGEGVRRLFIYDSAEKAYF